MRLARRAALLRPSMIREQTAAAGRRPMLSLAGGLPPPEAFPVEALAEVTARLLAGGDPGVLQYGATEGDPALAPPEAATRAPQPAEEPDAEAAGSAIPLAAREERAGHGAAVLWFTGLSGAGKSTIARALEWRLFERGCRTMLLDGDELRTGLCRDLGFTAADREENVRRAGEVARLCCAQGAIVLCTFVSPYRADRDAVRALVPPGRFYEVHVDCAVEECRRRDPKGLYARAARGEVRQLTGVDAPYEAPTAPELVARTETEPVAAILDALLRRLEDDGVLRRAAWSAAR